MATKTVYVDFRGGMIDERLRRRTDLAGYYNSASLIENAVPTRAGGLRLRPGLVRFSKDSLDTVERIIPFTKSVDESYVILLEEKKATIYGILSTGELGDVSGAFETEYKASEIKDIQYAQDYEKIVFAHENHPPFVIQSNASTGGFSAGNIVLQAYRNETRIDDKTETENLYDYDGLFTEKDFPSAVAFMSNRLWFMASREHSYRLWASRPFKYNDFQTTDYFQRIDESITVEEYLKALSGGKTTTETLEDGTIKKITTAVTADGVVTETTTITDQDGKVISQSTKAWSYTKPKYSWEEVVREDCSLELELASDRDERVSWIGYSSNLLYIGTASSEWAIPSDISAISMQVSKTASYGSAKNSQCVYGTNSIFYLQSGRKRIRAIGTSSSGISFYEPSYQCESILSSGVKEMLWQRVPEPRLYCVLNDGSMAVLCYDADYGVNAWCKWTFESLSIRSMAIMDSEDGQIPVVLAEDKSTHANAIYKFDDASLYDNGEGFKATVVTNNIDSDSSIPYTKKICNVYIDSFRTEFTARGNQGQSLTPRSFDKDLIKMDIYSASTLEGIRMRIESIKGKPFELLALAVEVEVS